MSKDGGGSKTRGLYILLGILCVAIIGLGVGIGIMMVNKEDTTEIINKHGSTGITDLEESIYSGYYPVNEISEEAYTHDYDYLTTMIHSGKTNDGFELDDSNIFFLKMVLVDLMIRYEKIEEAFEYLNNINRDNLSKKEMMSLYVAYSEVYSSMDDKEKALLYADMATNISNEIYSENE